MMVVAVAVAVAHCATSVSALRGGRQTSSRMRRSAEGELGGLTAEKAAQLESMGYRYDVARRRWTRGANVEEGKQQRRRTLLRSGMRSVTLMKLKEHEEVAAEAFVKRLRDARAASFGDQTSNRERDNLLKMLLSGENALPLLSALSVGLALALGGWQQVQLEDAPTILACGLGVAASRLFIHRFLCCGVDPPDGRSVERFLVDADEGGHALPSPWDWRQTERGWLTKAVIVGAAADLTRVALLHGQEASILQVALLAAGLVLVPDVYISLLLLFDDEVPSADGRADDGISAELAAADGFARGAAAYFASQGGGVEAAEQAVIVRDLARGWREKFGETATSGDGTYADSKSVDKVLVLSCATAAVETALAGVACAYAGGQTAAWLVNLCAALALALFPTPNRNVIILDKGSSSNL